MTNILLISEDYIKTHSGLNENIWGSYLTPAIITAQDIKLQSILGDTLYEALLNLVESGRISANDKRAYKSLLDEYIQPYLMWATLSDLVPIIAIKMANIGTVLSNDEHIQNISLEERNLLQKFYEDKADFYCKRLQDYLKGTREKNIKFDLENPKYIKPNLESAASTGLFLGGNRSRRIEEDC